MLHITKMPSPFNLGLCVHAYSNRSQVTDKIFLIKGITPRTVRCMKKSKPINMNHGRPAYIYKSLKK